MNRKLIVVLFVAVLLLFVSETKAEEYIRSSSLKEIVTKKENTMRRDYVDEQGVITYAADLRYATQIIVYSDDSQMEEFYDANGNPAKQRLGYFAIYREYNDLGWNWKITFLGVDKQPMLSGNGYASCIRTFYDNGNIKTEYYLDEQGNSIKTNAYGYGCYKEYDENNRNTVLIYLDDDGKPTMTGQGFAIVRRVYYEDGLSMGRVKEEFYFDANDEPTVLVYGQSGLHIDYDQFGRAIVLTYLDAQGDPIRTRAGYTTIKRTYLEDDSIEKEMYFDENGEPLSLSEGQYGVCYKDGKILYLDRNGREQFNIKRILYNNEWIVILAVAFVVIISIHLRRSIVIPFLFLYLLAIVYMTLLHRVEMTQSYYDILVSTNENNFLGNLFSKGMINNILLFLPLGTILFRLFHKKTILFVPVFISLLIELLQSALRIGLFEMNDIISNGIGSTLGYLAGMGLEKVKDMMRAKIIKNNMKFI